MKKYEIIAFDLDGTLSDPAEGLISSFEYTMKKLSLSYESRESLKRFIGPPLYDEWRRCFSFTETEADRAIAVFREYYSVYGWWDNRIYPGVVELLSAIKDSGKKIILATSKPEVFARKILKRFDIERYFDFISGACGEKVRDKKHEVLEYALASLGEINRNNVILVGDRKYDAEGARLCKVDSLGVLYGHGSCEEIAEAGFTYIAKTVSDVGKILLS